MDSPPRPASETRKLLRAVIGRCPSCGIGRPFPSWLGITRACPECGFRLRQREIDEPGFFLGATYINYGLSAIILVGVSLPLQAIFGIPFLHQMAWQFPFAILFPLLFLGRSRLLWLVLSDSTGGTPEREADPAPDFDRDTRFAKKFLWGSLALAVMLGLVFILGR